MTADIGKALAYQVSQGSEVIAILGANASSNGRFSPVSMPQTATFPLALYQEISGQLIHQHGEASVLPRPRIQITCWGMTYGDVVALDRAIKAAIDGKRGNWGTGSYVTMVESCVAETTPHDDRDPETSVFQRSRDYMIMWKE